MVVTIITNWHLVPSHQLPYAPNPHAILSPLNSRKSLWYTIWRAHKCLCLLSCFNFESINREIRLPCTPVLFLFSYILNAKSCAQSNLLMLLTHLLYTNKTPSNPSLPHLSSISHNKFIASLSESALFNGPLLLFFQSSGLSPYISM